ncbi:MAG: hypothetical protein JOZ49_05905 [Mycolicibacterium sp.]|nr:hypothetical protein [Mycolicibacterium sp.]
MNDWGRWFGTYLDTLTASARGDCDSRALLEYYGVPLLITGDDGFVALKSVDDVIGVMRGQVSRLREAEYHHTDVCHAGLEVLNSSSALCRATFAHRCGDGTPISELTATYLLTNGPAGVRISMLAVHADNGTDASARSGSAW